MIVADKRDYVRGYKKHYSAYKNLADNNAAEQSRRLLLAYCVECGLKSLLLDKWNENSPKSILENKQDKRNDVIKSHNLEMILKELNQQGAFHFPRVRTVHKDIISTEEFHQMCRYGIETESKDKEKEEKYEQELKKVAEWIREEM